MGDGRQRETSAGPLVPYPSSLVAPTLGEKNACLEALMEQQDGDDAPTNRWPGPDAAELNNDHQVSQTESMPMRVKAATTIRHQQ